MSAPDFADFFDDCSTFADFCAPPLFDLPPPPRPPWLDDIDNCADIGLCPSDPIVDSIDNVHGVFHSVITVIVAAAAIVISLILMAVFIWR